jgi:hypothetical protein
MSASLFIGCRELQKKVHGVRGRGGGGGGLKQAKACEREVARTVLLCNFQQS